MTDLDDDLPDDSTPEPMHAKVSVFTMVLCVLNIAAVLGFSYVLLMDLNKRQAWSYAVFRHDLALWGLPLEEEGDSVTGSQVLRKPQSLDADTVKKEFEQRNRGAAKGDKFHSVHEVIGQRILPEQLSDDILADLFKDFKDMSPPPRTLQEQVQRVQKKFPADVDKAAKETVQAVQDAAEKQKRKLPDVQRKKLGELLLPLAGGTGLIDRLHDKIQAAKAEQLEGMLDDAVQRKMYLDVLRPLAERRPKVVENDKNPPKEKKLRDELLEMGADRDVVSLDQLRQLFQDSCDEAVGKKSAEGKLGKESWEKREAIAYLLLVVGQARKPDNQPLYVKGVEEAAAVSGLHEHVQAISTLAGALRRIQQRVAAAIAIDRDGLATRSEKDSVAGFVIRHREQITRTLDLLNDLEEEKFRLEGIREIEKEQTKQHQVRKTQYDEVVAKLLAARTETFRQAAEMLEVERQLFRAQGDLADAAENNLLLERQIRDAERKARGLKR